MKTIEIVGKNYFGHWTRERTACRGVVIEDGRILLSYAVRDDLWMIPGGGLEAGEDEGRGDLLRPGAGGGDGPGRFAVGLRLGAR